MWRWRAPSSPGPPILYADEPTGNLDGKTGAQVLEMLLEMNQREGATLVMVTHDPALAKHASRIITLRDGLVISDELVDSGLMNGGSTKGGLIHGESV